MTRSEIESQIIPVILSGGTGSRLWPSSRASYPKQLLKLSSEKYSMLQETVLRLESLPNISPPMVICNQEHRFTIAEQLQEINIANSKIILEPEGKNTAPAALIAALEAIKTNPNSILLVLPADHLIQNITAFHQAVNTAVSQAKEYGLVTFGIKPNKPETGYGYINFGKKISNNIYQINQFVEKPDLATAEQYIQQENYLWNSGMFVFSAKSYIQAIEKFSPNMLVPCQASLERAIIDLDFIRLDKNSFSQCPSDSIDYAVMEKTQESLVVPLDAQWSDLGAWPALWEVLPKDENNNRLEGDVFTHGVTNSYIRAECKLVAAIGLSNLMVIETDDAILIADQGHAQEVKKIVAQLKKLNRAEADIHSLVYRPWGSYQCIDHGERFQVKRICVKPGAKLSLQLHYHRAEHWIVVKGKAKVTCGEKIFDLHENQSTYIPIETKHRLENPTDQLLEIIEVQSGDYLGEDDIVRFEDDYMRN